MRKTVKQIGGGNDYRVLYYLPNDVTLMLSWLELKLLSNSPSVYNVISYWDVFLERTPEQVIANQYSYTGVDTHLARIRVARDGALFAGENAYRIRWGALYNKSNASGGANCNVH